MKLAIRSKNPDKWKINKAWNHLSVKVLASSKGMEPDSLKNLSLSIIMAILKIDEHILHEYEVRHERWQVNKVEEYAIDCDFTSKYGKHYSLIIVRRTTF